MCTASASRSSLVVPAGAVAGGVAAGAGAPDARGTGGWRNRRSQKLDKMEILTLQSSLHSEIQAKQAVGEELSRTRAELLASQRYAQLYCALHSRAIVATCCEFTPRFTLFPATNEERCEACA